jgi:hypothetical protein
MDEVNRVVLPVGQCTCIDARLSAEEEEEEEERKRGGECTLLSVS